MIVEAAVGAAAHHGNGCDDARVDVAFDVVAQTLPRDHRAALRDALFARASWLADDADTGVHAIAAIGDADRDVVLSRRARLVLRVRASRAHDALALEGSVLDIAGHALRLGAALVKPLAAFPTVGASFVATSADDALAHEHAIAAMLEAIGVPRRFICGRMSRLRTGGVELSGGSVVVHALAPVDSLRLQHEGLGPHRAVGCGLFVPYKAIGVLD